MVLAWLHADPPSGDSPALRAGGKPLMPAERPWPRCEGCCRAMVFRAQVPLALTLWVAPDDPRLLLLFEHGPRRLIGCEPAHVTVVSPADRVHPPPPDAQPGAIAGNPMRGGRLIPLENTHANAVAVIGLLGGDQNAVAARCPCRAKLRRVVRLFPERGDHGDRPTLDARHCLEAWWCTRCEHGRASYQTDPWLEATRLDGE